MSAYALSVLGAVCSIAVIFEMVRRRALREKYAFLWIGISVVVLVVGVAPSTLVALSRLLGVEVPANLLFFAAGIVLLLISVQQSAELGRLEEKTRTLAEQCAELWLAVESASVDSLGGAGAAPDDRDGTEDA